MAELPQGADRTLVDPFAEKNPLETLGISVGVAHLPGFCLAQQ
jgi:hypothetical protein